MLHYPLHYLASPTERNGRYAATMFSGLHCVSRSGLGLTSYFCCSQRDHLQYDLHQWIIAEQGSCCFLKARLTVRVDSVLKSCL